MNLSYSSFFQELERDFERIKNSDKNLIDKSQEIILFLEKKLKKLNKWLKKYQFESQKEEIYFFKELRPTLFSKIILYRHIFRIETTLPAGRKAKRKHYSKELSLAQSQTREEREFYQYYRARATYKNHLYFVRRSYKDIMTDDPMQLYFDSKISTSHEFQVAKIICADMLINFLENKIDEIDFKKGTPNAREKVSYTWSGNKIDLIELIYAIKHAGMINHGNVDVKELAIHLGKVFNIELEDNIYRIYQDIKLRKTVRTKFLNYITDNLNQRMIEEDQ